MRPALCIRIDDKVDLPRTEQQVARMSTAICGAIPSTMAATPHAASLMRATRCRFNLAESLRRASGLRHGGVDARHRALPVVICSECTGIIRCSLGLPGNMT